MKGCRHDQTIMEDECDCLVVPNGPSDCICEPVGSWSGGMDDPECPIHGTKAKAAEEQKVMERLQAGRITPESHPELAEALQAAGLWYEGDKQDGFIKGYLAARKSTAPEGDALRTGAREALGILQTWEDPHEGMQAAKRVLANALADSVVAVRERGLEDRYFKMGQDYKRWLEESEAHVRELEQEVTTLKRWNSEVAQTVDDEVLAHAQRLEDALRKIVQWDDNEKPHKNLPLSDCAELARAALSPNLREQYERADKDLALLKKLLDMPHDDNA